MESSSRVNVSNPSESKKATFIASAITSFVSCINEHRSVRAARLVLIGLVCVFCSAFGSGSGSVGLADDATSGAQTAQLQDKLRRLEARDDAKYAKGALQQARLALQTASGPIEDANAVVRAQQIARAAMAGPDA